MVIARRIPVLVLLLAGLSVSCASTGSQAIANPNVCWQEAEPTALKAEAGSEVVAPRVLHRVDPIVPRNVERNATATIEAVIGEDGKPRHVCVASGDPVWGQAAAAAVRQWVFEPGTLDGKPVAVIFNLTTRFTAEGR